MCVSLSGVKLSFSDLMSRPAPNKHGFVFDTLFTVIVGIRVCVASIVADKLQGVYTV